VTPTRIAASLAVAAAVPLLAAVKCIEPDRRHFPPDARDDDDAAPVTPFVECPDPGQATLVVEGFAYVIRCGCVEPSGRTCTVNAGAVVVWQFADSEAHNVTSLANAFGVSTTQLVGSFAHRFDNRGMFGYGCSIHADVMSQYVIVVK
jgi:hypothetical protein